MLGRLGLVGLAALCIGSALPARADLVHPVSTPDAPAATPYVKDNGEVLIMVCRRGFELHDMHRMQEMPQDLPLWCLPTQASQHPLQAGAARFQQLLYTAASAGSLPIVVMPD